MFHSETELEEINEQIDIYLKRIPKRKIAAARFDLADLRQEIHLALLEKMPSYRPGRSSRRTFRDRIIKFRIMQYFRRSGRKKHRTEDRLSGDDLDATPIINEVRRGELKIGEQAVFDAEVRQVIEHMEPLERECCFRLMHYTPQEVAAQLKLRPNNFYRVMEKLKAAFMQANVHPGKFTEND